MIYAKLNITHLKNVISVNAKSTVKVLLTRFC